MNSKMLKFVSHRVVRGYACDAVLPMWHEGPCDCGLYEALDELTQDELQELSEVSPELVEHWKQSRVKKIGDDNKKS
jgi:hypothetical protein